MPLPKPGQTKDWVDCESLPERKKQAKKFGVTEPVKSPTDSGRSGMQTPTGRQIVSPEECSCDCHHTSPPHTLTKQKQPAGACGASGASRTVSSSVSSSGTARKVTPPTSKKTDLATKGAVPKSSAKRVGGPPTPPIRTTSVQKATKISAGTARTSSEKSKAGSSGSGKTPGGAARRPVRQKEEPQRGLTKRSSTVSSED